MKKWLLLPVVLLSFVSCSMTAMLDQRVTTLELGMSKQSVIKTLGAENYTIEQKLRIPEGDVEVLRFQSVSSYPYILHFLNGRLEEIRKYEPPIHPEVHVINKEKSDS